MPAPLGKDHADAGQYQRPKEMRPSLFARLTIRPGDDAHDVWWNHRGELYSDEALTKCTGLVIVEIVE